MYVAVIVQGSQFVRQTLCAEMLVFVRRGEPQIRLSTTNPAVLICLLQVNGVRASLPLVRQSQTYKIYGTRGAKGRQRASLHRCVSAEQ
jgi:hypothetical protein